MAWPRWHHILLESQRHALRAADEWNCSSGHFGDFISHMHKAWLYLLHAEFHKDGVDYHYTDSAGAYRQIDGEAAAWALEDCLKRRYPNTSDAIRLNGELFVRLRNKVEHRYEHGLKVVTGGKAQAWIMNYEAEMVDHFGAEWSLADKLRFPISLQALTVQGRDELRAAAAKLPKKTRDLVACYDAALGSDVLEDHRYDYRVRLVPVVGAKTDADLAVTFVHLESLSDDERKLMEEAGRKGTVLTKNRHVEVTDKGKMKPGKVAEQVNAVVPYQFSVQREHVELWRRLKVRPENNSQNPEETDSRYCVYSEVHESYVYTRAWVKLIISKVGTVEEYEAFFGKSPRMKAT